MKTTFKNDHLSFSRLQRYEQCPRSFKLHYVDGLPSESAPELEFGRAIHVVLEQLVGEHALSFEPAELSLDQAGRLWQAEWARSGLIGVGRFYEGLKILESFVAREGVLDPASILGTERPFEIEIGRFRVVGAIDRVDRTGDKSIRIRDYKTNRVLFTRDEVAESLQLSLYAIAARQLWPWAEQIELQYDMLRHDVRLRTARTDAELDAARRYIEALGERIEADGEFAPRPNPNCVHCDHKERCDAYAEALAGQRRSIAVDLGDLQAVAAEREEVARIAKVAYARKAQLEGVLRVHLQDDDALELGGVRYQLVPITSTEYDVQSTLALLQDATGLPRDTLIAKLATVDKDSLSKLLTEVGKRLPRPRMTMLRAELEARASKTVSPRFVAKHVKGADR
jgi:RecB family exonuclease